MEKEELRRLVLLVYMENGMGEDDLAEIDPLTFKEDVDFLESKGFIKDLKLTPEGKKILKHFSFRGKRGLERSFFSSNN
ncbi:MAG: hypothetical protein ACOCVY_01925 [Patescibacteria group bacterium]